MDFVQNIGLWEARQPNAALDVGARDRCAPVCTGAADSVGNFRFDRCLKAVTVFESLVGEM